MVEPETDVDPGGVEEGLHHHSQDHQGPGERSRLLLFFAIKIIALTHGVT